MFLRVCLRPGLRVGRMTSQSVNVIRVKLKLGTRTINK